MERESAALGTARTALEEAGITAHAADVARAEEVAGLATVAEELRAECDRERAGRAAAEEHVMGLVTARRDLERRLDAAQAECDRLTGSLEQQHATATAVEEQSRRVAALNATVSAAGATERELRAACDRAEGEARALRVGHDTMAAEVEVLRRTGAQLSDDLQHIKLQLATATEEVDSCRCTPHTLDRKSTPPTRTAMPTPASHPSRPWPGGSWRRLGRST